MPEHIRVKICGMKTPATIEAAAKSGAAYLGFNFFPKSPRSVSADEARALLAHVPVGCASVALFVNPTDAELDAVLDHAPMDMVQLHGQESPERVAEVKALTGLPVMKALGIATSDDVRNALRYAGVADQLLLDAKAPKDAVLPGGNGLAFDWQLLRGVRWPLPWMLAGGLNAANVQEAIAKSGAKQLDTASGVESAPGIKDEELISEFIRAAHA